MRGKMSNCFVCLSKTTNRVCPTCQCYAHPSCWGNYLKSIDKLVILSNDDMLAMLFKNSHECPICKTELKAMPNVTRKRTEKFRLTCAYIDMVDGIQYADEDNLCCHEKSERYHTLMRTFKRAKRFIKKDQNAVKQIKQELSRLYYNEGWKPANHYHMDLFGKQISKHCNSYENSGDISN